MGRKYQLPDRKLRFYKSISLTSEALGVFILFNLLAKIFFYSIKLITVCCSQVKVCYFRLFLSVLP